MSPEPSSSYRTLKMSNYQPCLSLSAPRLRLKHKHLHSLLKLLEHMQMCCCCIVSKSIFRPSLSKLPANRCMSLEQSSSQSKPTICASTKHICLFLFLYPNPRLKGHVSPICLLKLPNHPHGLQLPRLKITIWAFSVKSARETTHVHRANIFSIQILKTERLASYVRPFLFLFLFSSRQNTQTSPLYLPNQIGHTRMF